MCDLAALLGTEDKVQCKETFFFMIRPQKDEDAGEEEQWEGTIKTVTRIVTKSEVKATKKMEIIQQKIEATEKNIEQKIETNSSEVKREIEAIKQKIDENQEAIQVALSKILTKFAGES